MNSRLRLANQLVQRLSKRPRKGFTLIELLVVVVIIGILASVALPSFVGAQDKARNSAVQGGVNTVRMALEQYSTDNNGSYPSTGSTGFSSLAVNNYLPGNKIPRSPWATASQTSFVTVTDITAAGVASGSALPISQDLGGGTVSTQPSAVTHYGAIGYDLDTSSMTYVVMGTGKRNKNAIYCAGVSNGGQ